MEISVRVTGSGIEIGCFDGTNLPRTERGEKGKSIIAFPEKYCVVDLETTGISPAYNDIIEIGAIKYENGKEVDRLQTLMKPPLDPNGWYVDGFITALTGITNEMLADAPEPEEVLPIFRDFLGNEIIIGYNVGFDVNFIYDAFEEYLETPLTNNYIDALRFSRKLYPEMAHHRLCDMVEKYGITIDGAHRAITDVEATKQCFDKLVEEALRVYGSEEQFVELFKRKRHGAGSGVRAKNIVGDESKHDVDSPLFNKHCVFTGKLEKLTRAQAMQIVADLGGINEDSVTKKTNYLILGNNDYCASIKDGKSTKQKKAEQNRLKGQDIEILPETVFYDMINELL